MLPRPLTPEIRKRVGLPKVDRRPYNWSFAAFVVAVFCMPLAMGRWYWAAVLLAIVGLGVIPLLRHLERRGAILREEIYVHGREVVGRVVEVEPGTQTKRERERPSGLVHVEFFVDKQLVRATVHDSPLTRRGLQPGDDVVIVHAADQPTRCLVIERIAR